MKTKQLIIAVLAGLMAAGLTATAGAASPKMKMTTPIPPEITTPDKVETRLGTLSFKNGMPDQATIDKVYDNIDFARAVDVYLNNIRAVSMYANRKGLRDIGMKDNTIFSAERLAEQAAAVLMCCDALCRKTSIGWSSSGSPVP